ncbi:MULTISPECIES: extracellular solute-binding protein [unclassified Rhizobium]|uniref:extracellular solute-binding protein n=1 Tax=unclassified Rhizobium TaxID=2613769 RepID=UPI0038249C18
MVHVSRRAFTAALLSGLLPRYAKAQTSTIMVANDDVEFDDILRERIDTLMRTGHGAEVLHEAPMEATDLIRSDATARPNGRNFDVICLDELSMYGVAQSGLLAHINKTNLATVDTIRPSLNKGTSIAILQSIQAIAYNTRLVHSRPISLMELWSEANRGRVGLSRKQIIANTIYAAVAGGGSIMDLGPSRARLQQWRSLDIKVYPSDAALGAALKRGEVRLAMAPMASVYVWRKSDPSINSTVPQEGTISIRQEVAVQSGTRDMAKAFAYLDLMLDPSFQKRLALERGFVPTVKSVSSDIEIAGERTLGERSQRSLWHADLAYLWEQRAAILRNWKEVFSA